MLQRVRKFFAGSERYFNRFFQWMFFATIFFGKDGFFFMLRVGAFWIAVGIAVVAWHRIVDLYIRYASSIFHDRTATPMPFASRVA